MWILSFYRFYLSVFSGLSVYFFFVQNIWIALLSTIITRIIWFLCEQLLKRYAVQKDYRNHITEFKQLNGPYGIRIANKADKEWRFKESLAEVFTAKQKKLQKAVEQLEMMDTLFKAGMRPEGDEFLLHDLKLKYGKYRLEKNKMVNGQ